MPIDLAKFKKKPQFEPKGFDLQEEIEILERLKTKVVLTDKTKNKFQLANQIHKLLINDAKRPKYQQKILIEIYRSTFNDLKLYENRK